MDDVSPDSITLTHSIGHVRMQSAQNRARSSMAEQWPFKPLVESSNLSALTFPPDREDFCLVESPRKGMIFESSRSTIWAQRLLRIILVGIIYMVENAS